MNTVESYFREAIVPDMHLHCVSPTAYTLDSHLLQCIDQYLQGLCHLKFKEKPNGNAKGIWSLAN